MKKSLINNIFNLIIFICMAVFSNTAKSKDFFSADIKSVDSVAPTKSGEPRKMKIVVEVTNEYDRYSFLYVQAPNEWGKIQFSTKFKEKIVNSKNENLYEQGSFHGHVVRKGEKLNYVLVGTCVDGGIFFKDLGEKLMIFEHDPEIRIHLSLFVSDFRTGKCWIEKVHTSFKRVSYPEDVSEVGEVKLHKVPSETPTLPD